MQCDKCRRRVIIHQRYSGLHLCREHFIADLEGKAKKAVRFSGGLSEHDHILLACHGDYRGCALMHFMATLSRKRRGIRFTAMTISEDGSPGDAVPVLQELASSLGIRYIDSVTYTGITRIAYDTSLDDEALVILTAILKGETDLLLGPGRDAGNGLPGIRPFLHIPDREVALYTRIMLGYKGAFTRSRPDDPLTRDAQDLLSSHTALHPSAPHALVNLGERLRAIRPVPETGDPKGPLT